MKKLAVKGNMEKRIKELRTLKKDICNATDRLQEIVDKVNFYEDEEMEVSDWIECLQDSFMELNEDEHREEFGRLVGSQLFVNRANFMYHAASEVKDMLTDGTGDNPEVDSKYGVLLAELITKFADDYNSLSKQQKVEDDAAYRKANAELEGELKSK
jgi:hypothetical protein